MSAFGASLSKGTSEIGYYLMFVLKRRDATEGLYYKTFYGSNICYIVISESVSHFHPGLIFQG